jgi:hypothetical protein
MSTYGYKRENGVVIYKCLPEKIVQKIIKQAKKKYARKTKKAVKHEKL